MFTGFIIHFYIIFGTNLLTRGPTHIAVFLPISVFRRKGISKGVQTEWNLRERDFWNERDPGELELKSRKLRGGHEGGARAPHWALPQSRGPLVAPLTDFFRLYMSIYPKNIGDENRSGVPPPQASVATKNQSRPCSGTLPEGVSLTGGHLHHPGALHDEEGVVHPRGWGYVPVAMCSISLSRVLEVIQSWCITRFAIIVGSYDVSPPLLSCDELSFSLWDFVVIGLNTFMDLRRLDIFLAIEYSWWQWGIILIHLIYVLALNSRIPEVTLG